MLLALLAALLQLSLIVFIHELGHWFFAKISGVPVISFNIGFGAKLWSVKRGGTVYALRWIPIGGYVQLADDAAKNKSWLARLGVVGGGALFNILFAWLILYLLLAARQGIFLTGFYKAFLMMCQFLKAILHDFALIFARGDFAALSGPVGILSFSAAAIERGWAVFWLFAALLSLNLGVINLLPFPALDGGRLLFLFYELLFRRQPSPRLERAVHSLGLGLLLALIIFLSFQDIAKIFS
ncbi:MAG: site-2 protease family protein [Candidatus Margulisbacteria bacterium]|jgi:regulator of sigma E protease|nr:site-2 protease family protein [Candidatus Margulisiibacteriota bacterium]